MSDEREYPVAVIQEAIRRHQADVQAVGGLGWLAEVVGLLRQETAVVPPLEERLDSIPEYIYPH